MGFVDLEDLARIVVDSLEGANGAGCGAQPSRDEGLGGQVSLRRSEKDQDAISGRNHHIGATVVVEVSSGIAPVISMIDLRGLPKDIVGDRISEFALSNGIALTWSITDAETPNPDLYGLVVMTTPAPGEPVVDGQNVVVRIGKAQ